MRTGVADAAQGLLRRGQRFDQGRDFGKLVGYVNQKSLVLDDALGQKAVQSDDAALANATGEAQVSLVIEARRALLAPAPDCWHHQVADVQRVHSVADALDAADRLMAQDQIVIAGWQRTGATHPGAHDVSIGAAHAYAQHLHYNLMRIGDGRLGNVGEPGAAGARTSYDCTHECSRGYPPRPAPTLPTSESLFTPNAGTPLRSTRRTPAIHVQAVR